MIHAGTRIAVRILLRPQPRLLFRLPKLECYIGFWDGMKSGANACP